MRAYVVAFSIAAMLCAILTPFVRRFALRIGAVSIPGGRNIHARRVPRLGGVAIFIAFCAPLFGLIFVESSVASTFRENSLRAVGLIGGGFIMCAVGFVDDTRRMRALYKLYAQIGAAILAFACGFQIQAVKLPLFGDLSMGVFALPITVLWVVGIVNAINLVDGLDGLAAGIVFFAGLTNFVVACLTDAVFPALVMAATLGAVLGFLFYNFNPARIFMGDSGSYFLGYVLATAGLVGSVQKTSTAVSLLVPIVAMGIPIFDTLFSMVRRLLERRPIFAADRGHLHHRLLDMGITHRRAVLILYGVCVAFTIAAVGVSLGRVWQAGIALLAASAVMIGLVRFVGYFEYLNQLTRQKARFRSRHAELLRRVIPKVPALFANACDEDTIWQALRGIQKEAKLTCVELVRDSGKYEEMLLVYVDPTVSDPKALDLVSARFPLGRDGAATCALRFRWESDQGDVSPHCEVLLQVLVDVVTTNLARVGSPHVPPIVEAEPNDEVVASVPSAIELGAS
jgi:UDP-GlcNAc:undecaprenyl-phosphate/decaprenyl-phosphate GlcNAc-1-phosphate transferase